MFMRDDFHTFLLQGLEIGEAEGFCVSLYFDANL